MIASTVRALLGRGRRATLNLDTQTGTILFLHGKSDYPLEVSRAARHQAEIHEIVRGKREPWHRFETLATLLVEETPPGERASVAVEIDRRVVGYLPGHLATQFREWLQSWNLGSFRVRCNSVIVNWTGGDSGAVRYTVRLDIELPFKMTLS